MGTSRPRFAGMPDAATISRHAARVIARCRELAAVSDVPGETTRTFLSPAMREAMERVSAWMRAAGCEVQTDAMGNLRGLYGAEDEDAARLLMGSHLDTVPNAGAFDGVLGVMIALALVEILEGARLRYALELIAFSEEEGVRFHVPFLGSRALVGRVDDALLALKDDAGVCVEAAVRGFGLETARIDEARVSNKARGYVEFHLEQGPVLESEGCPLGVVEAVAGQTRGEMMFYGAANHAGTTPMHLRRDAVAAMAEWILQVEQRARETEGLVATVGRVEARPGAGNVVAGEARASLDVRHAEDDVRKTAVAALLEAARMLAERRGVGIEWQVQMEQAAVPMDGALTRLAELAVKDAGVTAHRMTSGAGHDAMIVAGKVAATMIFVRTPEGLSHHPDEAVGQQDVEAALRAGVHLLRRFELSEDGNA